MCPGPGLCLSIQDLNDVTLADSMCPLCPWECFNLIAFDICATTRLTSLLSSDYADCGLKVFIVIISTEITNVAHSSVTMDAFKNGFDATFTRSLLAPVSFYHQ